MVVCDYFHVQELTDSGKLWFRWSEIIQFIFYYFNQTMVEQGLELMQGKL